MIIFQFQPMKKILLCSLLLFLFLSCEQINNQIDNYKNYRLDGMWQLKTVGNVDGNTIPVDTVYYSFQRETVFSFTLLENPQKATVVYGYLDMPSSDRVHVLIDKNSAFGGDINLFLNLSGWSSADVVFDIKKYNHSDLVLFDSGNGKTYTLKKF